MSLVSKQGKQAKISKHRINRSRTTFFFNKMGQACLSEGFVNRMLHDVMNNVLGNILTMSDEFHRAVYFLTTLKLGHWHHNEVCFTKKTASCYVPSGRGSGYGRERRNGNGTLTCLLRGGRIYSMKGGRAIRLEKVKSECVSWEINELVKITGYIRVLGTH